MFKYAIAGAAIMAGAAASNQFSVQVDGKNYVFAKSNALAGVEAGTPVSLMYSAGVELDDPA